jgi:hypothetical protein
MKVAMLYAWACCAAVAMSVFPYFVHAQATSRPSLSTVAWDLSTLRLVEPGGDYGRMARLKDGSIACVCNRASKMWIRHSTDEGLTWKEPILVAQEPDCWLTNADLLPLVDGTLLYFWNDRPVGALKYQHEKAPPGVLTRPFLIRAARSTDLGRTWSEPQILYTAGNSFQDGCWEPVGLQLPSGEVQVYFSNEFPFQTTAEQEISLLRSFDNGRTWTKAERIAMRKDHRDGMPVPLLLAGGRGIAVAIEDNGYAGERFKPVILHTSLEDNWRSGVVDGGSPRRWGALVEPLAPAWYGGGPFLRQLPSGETVLSYQESEDGTVNRCQMAVCVGDEHARNFTNKTYPLPLDPKGNQAWNSLFVKDAHTLTAISNATIKGVRGIWAIDGRVSRPNREAVKPDR